jgi:hypothetical protein
MSILEPALRQSLRTDARFGEVSPSHCCSSYPWCWPGLIGELVFAYPAHARLVLRVPARRNDSLS